MNVLSSGSFFHREPSMLYLSNAAIRKLQPSWETAIEIVEQAVKAWSKKDYAQPIKPYLRYRNSDNRIIAMPGFVGAPFEISGIKWIASFPGNLKKQLPRAHSLTLLNECDTGKPIAVLSSAQISGIRTAAVSGLFLKAFLNFLPQSGIKVGICGLGPIGQLHMQMLTAILGDRISETLIYDINTVGKKQGKEPCRFVNSWLEAYSEADIFITCTTASVPYIQKLPKPGSLQLNVSLRDYAPEIIRECRHIVVDDWEEVCREGTNIEAAHIKYGLRQDQTSSLIDIVVKNYAKCIDPQKFAQREFAMFNPMGMAIFDIALAKHYYDQALKERLGTLLEE